MAPPEGYPAANESSGGDDLPKLHLRKKSTRSEKAGITTIFVGLAFRITEKRREYAVVAHDGMGVVGQERDVQEGAVPDDVIDRILSRLREYGAQRGHRIALLAIAGPLDEPLGLPEEQVETDRDAKPSLLSRIWLDLDAIPCVIDCKNSQFSLMGEAVRAVELALESLNPTTNTIIKAGTSATRREVLVDAQSTVRLYDLHQQAALTSPELWSTFTALACPLRRYNAKISFFSATPRGGGVALMRHSLIRIWNLVGLDVKWYVPQGDSAVFDVTKRKFHNVLQGVNAPDIKLKEDDRTLFENWTQWNYEQYWKDTTSGNDDSDGKSPLEADIVVIDDPQLTALIPIIRKKSPKTKIIFRSHIEIRSDLVDGGKNPQNDVFSYLFNFIKDADLYVSHPVHEFVPKMVKDKMPVVYQPPSTDPLDGLNKPIPEEDLEGYRFMFNDLMRSSTGQEMDWKRGYILQVARFDPSKGIPDLVEGYRLFRNESKNEMDGSAPQLILIGHTSVDDPDATQVLHDLQETIGGDEYKDIRDDIYALRAPPDDRLLNALMRGADIACQVSTREGFEIKVTEAIHKLRWIVATKAGGIPLQIRDGVDGKLVPPGSPKDIAAAFRDFYASGKDQQKTGESRGNYIDRPLGGRWKNEGEGPREELFSVGNAAMWMYQWNYLLGFTKEQVDDLPEPHRKKLDSLGLNVGKQDPWKLNGKKVFDLLCVRKDEPS